VRKEFAAAAEKASLADRNVIFMTGDLGFMALENLRGAIKKRFINAGVSEQNMVSLAAGLASQGLTVMCYSIAPFAVFRPAEQTRLDVCLHNMDVKIIGNGGGYGYGIMGATHHALEDIAVMSSFQNMVSYIPFCNEDVEGAVAAMMSRKGPAYLRLGSGAKPATLEIPPYAPVRRVKSGKLITVAAMGPIVLNALKGSELSGTDTDIFAISEIPFDLKSSGLIESVKRTGRLLVAEEHVQRGGLGEYLTHGLAKSGVSYRFAHRCAAGYPGGTYGSQQYHQKLSGLDAQSLANTLKELDHE
jgi:transketolase